MSASSAYRRFVKKLKSPILWGNFLAMAAVLLISVIATMVGLNRYTRHGEAISIPNVTRMPMIEARRILANAGLNIEVNDTGYVKELPMDYVLEQKPTAGAKVKEGHIVSIIVNASSTPTIALPDIVQNCSLREALAKLKAMGFKVGETEYVTGEKEWVYGMTVDGRQMRAGERVSVNKTVIVQAGNGMMSEEDSVIYVESHAGAGNSDVNQAAEDDIDDFVEVP